ncbi:MAG TPA: helix-turn-helix transcriptional regulator [Thermoguttaceae bacterium]|nr:helix-turn-helix transcriptional regulator [Thermoguttaceae bacterium]
MQNEPLPDLDYQSLELDAVRYVVLRESHFERLCRAAGIQRTQTEAGETAFGLGPELDRQSLAARLIRRRRASGLSQAELARRAGVRPETLNRIERGRTTPDFATMRKLVVAIDEAQSEQASREVAPFSQRRTNHAKRK